MYGAEDKEPSVSFWQKCVRRTYPELVQVFRVDWDDAAVQQAVPEQPDACQDE